MKNVIMLTFFHLYSSSSYGLQNGSNLQSAIYDMYVAVYISAVLLSVTEILQGREAVNLLNAIGDSGESELFSGSSWESDPFLQSYALQATPIWACPCLGSGFILP